jgi:endonuclease-3
MTKKMSPAKGAAIIRKLEEIYGLPEPDLKFKNLYQLIIAVVLSAQTTDRQVNSVTKDLFIKYRDFKSLAAASAGEVESIIKSTGFYHTKAKNIIALAREITEKYNAKVPETMKELTALPGVGRKTANVVMSIGFGIPALAVDTHVSRLAQRLGFSTHKEPDKIEKDVCSLLPPETWTKAHLLLIKHGRILCKARNPLCEDCALNKNCLYFHTTYLSCSQENL